MENNITHTRPTTTDNNANRSELYISLTIAIIIGLVGVFIRFAPDVMPFLDQFESLFSWIANIAIVIAAFLAFRIVFEILGYGKKK